MKNEQKRPSRRRSFETLVVLGTVATGCLGAFSEGCGGSTEGVTLEPDGGSGTNDGSTTSFDGSTTEDGSGLGTDSGPLTADSGGDATLGGDSGQSQGDSGGPGTDSGGSDSGQNQGDSSATDSGPPPACSGSETACTTAGSTPGLCVGGACVPCTSPGDNANCSTAYADGGSAYVCSASGSCVPGNCVADTDCAGELCVANRCAPCTGDPSCQSDPSYGPGTVCASSGTCVSAACTSAGACTTNSADFCCAASTTADCSGTDCSCVPGDCCTNVDCATNPAGSVCGATTPNTCGPCTTDAQCGSGEVCNLTSGTCSATSPSYCTGSPGGGVSGGGEPGTCSVNANDMCCSTSSSADAGIAASCIPSTGAEACCPGTAGNTYCSQHLDAGAGHSVCDPTAFVCTTCGVVSGTTYIVDPNHGDDQTGTGSGQSSGGGAEASCALKTITRALAIIGTPAVPTTIQIVGGGPLGPSVASGEKFPLKIPALVTVTTTGTGAVTVTVPASNAGFALSGESSQITSAAGAPMSITAASGALVGIEVLTGSLATTTISHVAISGFAEHGILVSGTGVASIGPGVAANNNGSSVTQGDGLEVVGTGQAIVTGSAASPSTFDGNASHGILVLQNGSLILTGTVAGGGSNADYTSTVETNDNVAAGVWIDSPTASQITGLLAFGNTAGNGMRIVAGSAVTVRNSVFLGNKGNGVLVATSGTTPDVIGKIDLGNATAGGGGGNVFQAPLGKGNNSAVGICYDVSSKGGGGGVLLAVGNQFQAANCATGTATLSLNAAACANNTKECATGVCDLGFTTAADATGGDGFNVGGCTQ